MPFRLKAALAAAVLTISTQTYATTCTQADLTGSWRMQFNTGEDGGGNGAIDTLDCIVTFRADGSIVPVKCDAVNSHVGGGGGFAVFTPSRKFVVHRGCVVSISGTPGTDDFELQFFDGMGGKLGYGLTGANFTITANKQMMLGWMSFGGSMGSPVTPRATVIAIRR